MPQTATIDFALIPDVLESAQALLGAAGDFRSALLSEPLPVWLPPTFPPADARETAVAALARLWYDDVPPERLPPSGLLQVTPAMMTQVETFNAAKNRFRDAVTALRSTARAQRTPLARLLEETALKATEREQQLAQALRRMGFARLDLQNCYRRVGTLDPRTTAISWSWIRQHGETRSLTRDDALLLADALDNDKARETALNKLEALPPETRLAYRRGARPQLRANLLLMDGDERLRKHIVTSGVLVTTAPFPARLVWRDAPSQAPNQLPRADAVVDPEPFIAALHLHRYTDRARA